MANKHHILDTGSPKDIRVFLRRRGLEKNGKNLVLLPSSELAKINLWRDRNMPPVMNIYKYSALIAPPYSRF